MDSWTLLVLVHLACEKLSLQLFAHDTYLHFTLFDSRLGVDSGSGQACR